MNIINTVLITNVPAPYRVPVWRKIMEMNKIDLTIIFCAQPQIDTKTAPTDYGFNYHFLSRFLSFKRPIFALEVALSTAKLLNRKTSINFVGNGELEAEMRAYATQAELPYRYAAAKIFLFPTEGDVWGVVANEACASGLPVIVSPYFEETVLPQLFSRSQHKDPFLMSVLTKYWPYE